MDMSLRAALAGLNGLPGAAGAPVATGATGAPGADGAVGPVGPPGPPGEGSGSGSTTFSINVSAYGAVGDGKWFFDCSVTSGSDIATAPSGTFAVGDVGKILNVAYHSTAPGGVSKDASFNTTIVAFVDSANVRMAIPPTISDPTAQFVFGTDDGAAIIAAVAAMNASPGITRVDFDNRIYLSTLTISLTTSYKGLAGADIGVGSLWGYYPYYYAPSVIADNHATGTMLVYVGAPQSIRFISVIGNTTQDIWGAFLHNLCVDGRFRAGSVIYEAATVTCDYKNIVVQAKDVSDIRFAWHCESLTPNSADYPNPGFSRINCVYANRYTRCRVVGTWLLSGASASYGGTNTCFCTFYSCSWSNLEIWAADDNQFFGCFSIGGSVTFDSAKKGAAGKPVETCTFYGVLVQGTAGGAGIVANGSKVIGCRIYGLSGTDNPINVSVTSGADLFYDYLGSALGGAIPHDRVPALKVVGDYFMLTETADGILSTAALGAYAGKIKISVGGGTKRMPYYDN